MDKWRPATYFYRVFANPRPISTGFGVAKKPAATYFYRFFREPRPISTGFGPSPATYFYLLSLVTRDLFLPGRSS